VPPRVVDLAAPAERVRRLAEEALGAEADPAAADTNRPTEGLLRRLEANPRVSDAPTRASLRALLTDLARACARAGAASGDRAAGRAAGAGRGLLSRA